MGLKDVISKDRSEDMFKELIFEYNKHILKEDITKWVNYKFNRYICEKKIRKIRNLLQSKSL